MSNVKVFLDLLAWCEGTSELGDNGYNVLVGGDLFYSYRDHPRKLVYIPRLKNSSSAAGRYQILERYYDHYSKLLGLKDFSPDSQDKIAIKMIKEQNAYRLVIAGKVISAVNRVNNIWASLPGSPYGQGGKTYKQVLAKYAELKANQNG